jgi:glycine/D-amino acid oxidase-like deaminating enzyme
MFWIPIIIGAGAAGAAAALLLDEEEEGNSSSSSAGHQNKSQSKRSGTTAQQSAQCRERLKRRARYRKNRDQRVDAFLEEHDLEPEGAGAAKNTMKPDRLLRKVEGVVEKRLEQIEQPLAEIGKDLDELSVIRDELVAVVERNDH